MTPLVLSLVLLGAVSGDGAVFTATRGLTESELPISEPVAFLELTESTFAVYGRRDCTIHIVDRNLADITTFGRCGEGPGDTSDVRAMANRGDEIWLVLPNRISRFSLEGHYRGDLALAGADFDAAAVVGDVVMGVSHGATPTFYVVSLAVEDPLPRTVDCDPPYAAPTTDSFHSIGADGTAAYFVGTQSGEIVMISASAPHARRLGLGLREADVEVEHSSSGTVSTWRAPVIAAWIEGDGILHAVTSIDNPPPGPEAIEHFRKTGELPVPTARRYDLTSGRFESYRLVRLLGSPSAVYRMRNGEWAILDRWNSVVWLASRLGHEE